MQKRQIAIFDYLVSPTNPIGGCHLRVLRNLCEEHDFTVFSVTFDNPCPDRIRWVRIPAPRRPMALLFLVYHTLAPLYYVFELFRRSRRFDAVQIVESNASFGDVSYSQFCHRFYLKHHWKQSRPKGIRGTLRWLDHALHVLTEPFVFRRVRWIVVASRGLAREISAEYPFAAGKLVVIANGIELSRMSAPDSFDRRGFREAWGLRADVRVLVFAALGHFERKGLPILLEAMRQAAPGGCALMVVGGERDLVASYRSRVTAMGLTDCVSFAGMQTDVRPFFWAADAFVLPSLYEVFPLVALEAAAAGLPLIVSPLNGVEEFLRPGENGICVDVTGESVGAAVRTISAMEGEGLKRLGDQGKRDVQQYSVETFVQAWRSFYQGIEVRR
jgi:glycosyltransferase involved in cell wall biosynthesis